MYIDSGGEEEEEERGVIVGDTKSCHCKRVSKRKFAQSKNVLARSSYLGSTVLEEMLNNTGF